MFINFSKHRAPMRCSLFFVILHCVQAFCCMSVPLSFKNAANMLGQGSSYTPVDLRWSLASGLQCPYGSGVDIPLCGKVYDLNVITEKSKSGSPPDLSHVDVTESPILAGRAVFCDPRR